MVRQRTAMAAARAGLAGPAVLVAAVAILHMGVANGLRPPNSPAETCSGFERVFT